MRPAQATSARPGHFLLGPATALGPVWRPGLDAPFRSSLLFFMGRFMPWAYARPGLLACFKSEG